MDTGRFDENLCSRLRDRLDASGRKVAVLLGPACSGKTTAAIGTYRQSLDEASRPSCLLIGPNARAVAQMKRRLLAASPTGVLISPAVMTFASLAGKILAACGRGGRMLDPAGRHILLRRIVDELNRSGRLACLGAVADAPGLITVVERTIHELKRAAVAPEQLAEVIGKPAGKAADLLAVYSRYQQHLQQAGAYDTEGRMWEARDALAEAAQPPPALSAFETAAVDGFTDFTPTQLDILRLLARGMRRVVITLPYADDGRGRLWKWTRRTLERIHSAFAGEIDRIDMGELAAPGPASQIIDLGAKLFDLDAEPLRPDGRIGLIAAAGAEAEVAAVAARIKRLLRDAETPGPIAVIYRAPADYRQLIERIFAAYDIPIAEAAGPLADVPIVRFALRVASLGPRFDSRDVLGVISSSYLRPEALGPFDSATAATAQMLIREANIVSGRRAYAAAVDRLARRTVGRDEDEDDSQELSLGVFSAPASAIRRAGRMLEALFELVGRTVDAGSLGGLLDALDLEQVAAETADPITAARDLRALAALRASLASVEDHKPSPTELADALAAVTCPPARGESVVDVLDILDARSCRWDHVFLIGLGEGQFPTGFSQSPLIGQAERAAFCERGLHLDSRQDITAREMLLFYLGATRGQVSVTLSYPRWDSSGQDKAPGAFLLAAVEALGGAESLEAKRLIETIPPGRLLPPGPQLAAPRDALVAGAAGLFNRQLDPDGKALFWASEHAAGPLRRWAAGIRAQRSRWSAGECDEFDGRIGDPALLGRLGSAFGPEAVLTPSQLNTYGRCPWQFFARYVLRLQPLAEPQRRLEAASVGTFCHNVLFRVMQQLAKDVGRPVRLASLERQRLQAVLAEAVEAESDRLEARQEVPYPSLWTARRRQLHQQLAEYLLNQRAGDRPAACLCFELRFGRAAADVDLSDPASTDEPVVLKTPTGPVRLAGRIDRVDQVTVEEGEAMFVVDYKYGSPPNQADIDDGRALQLPIYAEAAEQILCEPSAGGAFHSLRDNEQTVFSTVKAARGRSPYRQRLAAAFETIGRFVNGIRTGRFDAVASHDCPAWCPYRRICQFSPPRAQLKGRSREPRS